MSESDASGEVLPVPSLSPDERRLAKMVLLEEQFRAYSRQPFIDILSRLTGCAPSNEALQQFADQHPERWASAVRVFAGLSGFTEKLEIKGNIAIEVYNMGDAQLLDKLQKVEGKLLDLEAKDITPVPDSSAEADGEDK